jgi:hypothetical protein
VTTSTEAPRGRSNEAKYAVEEEDDHAFPVIFPHYLGSYETTAWQPLMWRHENKNKDFDHPLQKSISVVSTSIVFDLAATISQ